MSGLTRGAVLGVIVLVSLAAVAWIALGKDTRWDEASRDGDTDTQLVVTYAGGSCETQRSTDVDETESSITITVTTRTLARSCDDMANARTVVVQLDRPLGDRVLLDGSCDEPRSCQRKLTD